jgi:hypothetical protein
MPHNLRLGKWKTNVENREKIGLNSMNDRSTLKLLKKAGGNVRISHQEDGS